MPTKEGNGGYGQESYDPKTGKYVSNGGGSSSGDESLSDTLRQALLMGNYKGINLKNINVSAVISKNITAKMQDKAFADKVNKANEIYNSNDLTKLFKKKDRDYSPLEDCFCVNKQRYNEDVFEYSNNCQRCAPTFVARFCWGLDVEALAAFDESEIGRSRAGKLNPWSSSTVYSVYEGWTENDLHINETKISGWDVMFDLIPQETIQKSWKLVDDFMKDLPERAVCQLCSPTHTFVAVKMNGRVYAVEPQGPEHYGSLNDPVNCFEKMDIDHRKRFFIESFLRVDNLRPSPRITGIFQNRES